MALLLSTTQPILATPGPHTLRGRPPQPVPPAVVPTSLASPPVDQYTPGATPHPAALFVRHAALSAAALGAAVAIGRAKPANTLGQLQHLVAEHPQKLAPLGRVLKRYQASEQTFALLPNNPWLWAQVIPGVIAVNQANKAVGAEPPPWLKGMQTVAVLHPLLAGTRPTTLMEMAVLAPMVGLAVTANRQIQQGLSTVANALNPTRHGDASGHHHPDHPYLEHDLPAPVKVATSVGVALGLFAAYPKVNATVWNRAYKAVSKLPVSEAVDDLFYKMMVNGRARLDGFRQHVAASSQKLNNPAIAAVAAPVTCSNGCCQALLCVQEAADFLGALVTGKRPESSPPQPASPLPAAALAMPPAAVALKRVERDLAHPPTTRPPFPEAAGETLQRAVTQVSAYHLP